jgi:hypothetical protein
MTSMSLTASRINSKVSCNSATAAKDQAAKEVNDWYGRQKW